MWADGAYFSEKQQQRLKNSYRSHINRTKKFFSHSVIARENRPPKIRKRVELFLTLYKTLGKEVYSLIGLACATLKIGLMNFNL